MLLNYKFTKKLYRTKELLENLSIPEGTLYFWKAKWSKDGNDTWNMGLRLINKKAYWDPIIFVNWLTEFKLTNRPSTPEQFSDQKSVIAFIKKNVGIQVNGS